MGAYKGHSFLGIYVSNLGQDNFLFRNNGVGTFTEVARELNVPAPTWSRPTWLFDYDNDGLLDLFVASYSFSVAEVVDSSLRRPVRSETLQLYKNLVGGKTRRDRSSC